MKLKKLPSAEKACLVPLPLPLTPKGGADIKLQDGESAVVDIMACEYVEIIVTGKGPARRYAGRFTGTLRIS